MDIVLNFLFLKFSIFMIFLDEVSSLFPRLLSASLLFLIQHFGQYIDQTLSDVDYI